MAPTPTTDYPNILKELDALVELRIAEMTRIQRRIESETNTMQRSMQKKLELRIKPLQKEYDSIKASLEKVSSEVKRLRGE